MVWDTEEAAFISGEKAGEDRTTELRDYAGNAATVDFLKEVLLQQRLPLGRLSENPAEEEAYASLLDTAREKKVSKMIGEGQPTRRQLRKISATPSQRES